MPSAIPSTLSHHTSPTTAARATRDPAWARWVLIAIALLFLGFFLVLPLVIVFSEALSRGLGGSRS